MHSIFNQDMNHQTQVNQVHRIGNQTDKSDKLKEFKPHRFPI